MTGVAGDAITAPPTDLGATPTPPGTDSLPTVLVLLATLSSVTLAVALSARRRTR